MEAPRVIRKDFFTFFTGKLKDNHIYILWDMYYKFESSLITVDDIKNKFNELLGKGEHTTLIDKVVSFFNERKENRRFYMEPNFFGFGYEVRDRQNKKFISRCTEDEAREEVTRLFNGMEPRSYPEVISTHVLVIENKYSDTYASINTYTKFRKFIINFLKQEVNKSNFEEPKKPEFKKTAGMSKGDIEKLPDGDIKKYALELLSSHNEKMDSYRDRVIIYNDILQLFSGGNLSDITIGNILSYNFNWVLQKSAI